MAHAGGRPKVIDEHILKILEDVFSVGGSDRQACFMANISDQTLYNYQKAHPEFIERKATLKDMPKYKAKKVVVSEINKGDKDIAKWYLERRAKEFKPKSDLTSDDEPLKQVLVKFISEEPKDETTREDNRDTNRV